MEPVEINAGAWYLRVPRADDRVDDRAALADLGEPDPDRHVRRVADGWVHETRFTWAVCEPTTGELVAEISLDPAGGQVSRRARAGHAAAAQDAVPAVCRFAAGALGLSPVVTEAGGAAPADEDPGRPGGAGDQDGDT